MKKNLLTSLGLICAVFAFASCSFTIPKKVYLKTNAEYNFTVADYSESFSKYFDVKSLQESMGAESGIQIMDYNPAGTCKEQRFLAKIELMSIPVDMTEYIRDLTVDGLSVEQKIAIPSASINETNTLALSELSEDVNGAIEFAGPFLGSPRLTVSRGGDEIGTFSAAVYRSGTLDIYVENADPYAYVSVENEDDFVGYGYFEELATPVTKSIYGTEYTAEMKYVAHIDLAGRSVSMSDVIMEFSGIDTSIGKFFVGEILESSEIEKISGVNLATTFDSLAPQAFTIDFTEFDSLEIGEATFNVDIELPAEWKNADLDFTYSIKLDDEEWITNGKGGVQEVLKDKVLKNGTLTVTPEITLTITDGEVTLYDDLQIAFSCAVNKINSITLDKTALSLDSALAIDPIPLPEEVTKIVKGIWFGQSELRITSLTDLPEGNDIEIGIDSSFLKFDNQKFTLKNGEQKSTLTATASSDYTLTENAAVDITPTLKLPNEAGSKFTLKNIEPGKEYSLSLSVVPEVKWEKLKIDLTSLDTGIKSDVAGMDTGLNFGEILSGVNGNMGSMLKNLKLAELPVYIYCQTGIDAFSGISIKGDLSLTNGTETVNVLENTELKFIADMPDLTGDEKGVVTDDISKKAYSGHADIAKLIDFESTDSLKVFYDLAVTGADNNDIVIEHDSLEKVSNFEVMAIVDLPIRFKIEGEGTSVDLMELMSGDSETPEDPENIWSKDVLNRSEPYDMAEMEQYFSVIKEASIKLTSSLPLVYEDGSSINLKLKLNSASSAAPKIIPVDALELSLTNEELRYILENPFTPEVSLVLPPGELRVNRGLDFQTKIDLRIATDGKIPLWENN